MALTMIAGVGRILPTTEILGFISELIGSLLETLWTVFFLNLLTVRPEVAAFLSALVLAFRVTMHANRLALGSDVLAASIVSWRGALIVWGFLGYLYISGSAAADGYQIIADFIGSNRTVEIISVVIIGGVFCYLFFGWLAVFSLRRQSFNYGCRSLALAYAETGIFVATDQFLQLLGLPTNTG